MKPQFQHQLVTSFALWLDYVILQKGEAYYNIESQFFYQEDDRLDDDFYAFASPHKQWVYDASIKGAHIIDEITINNKVIKKAGQNNEDTNIESSAVRYDYNNGRVLIPKFMASPTDIVSGKYSVKDFNIYITDQTEEELLIETKFDKNSRFDQEYTGGVKPYDQVVPAIFVSYENGHNDPFAFGGMDTTKSYLRCVVFAENSYQLDGIFSILKDLNNTMIVNVGFNEHPLNEFGDLKYGYYDYIDLSSRYYDRSNSFCNLNLEKVIVSKMNDRVAKKTHPGLYIGFIDVEIHAHRYPRAPLIEPQAQSEPNIPTAAVPPYELTLSINFPNEPFDLTLDSSDYMKAWRETFDPGYKDK